MRPRLRRRVLGTSTWLHVCLLSSSESEMTWRAPYFDLVNSRLICATFSLPECATCWGTVSARVNPDRGGKESAISHGAKHDQVSEAAGAVRHADRLACQRSPKESHSGSPI